MESKSKIRVAFIVPSRGLIHSRTIESILTNMRKGDKIFFSHDNPIPQCFNIPIEEALKEDFTHIFIVEEDIVLDRNTLVDLLTCNSDIAAADYSLGNGHRVVSKLAGITLCGTGATLFKREALESLMPFNSNVVYDTNMKVFQELTSSESLDRYGLHDIDMLYRAQQAGYSVQIKGTVKHLKVLEHGEANKNNGFHKIVEK